MTSHSEKMERALERLAAMAAEDVDPKSLLAECVSAVPRIFGLVGAGIMLADPASALRTAASSDERAREVELVQQEIADGPCVRAFVLNRVLACDDTASDDRWPVIGPRIAELGVGAALGVPLRIGGAPAGVLNVYADAHPWGQAERRSLEAFAQMVEGLLAAAAAAHRSDRLATQLTAALESRVTIDRAVGYVIAGTGADAVEAFQMLRRAARSSNRKLVDLAADVLTGAAVVGADRSGARARRA